MAETGKKGKKKKGKTLNLNEFLAKDAESGSAVGATAVFAATSTNWADESEGLSAEVDNAWPEESYGGGNKVRAALDRAALPTAPRASRGSDVDASKVPRDPPYTAFLGNLSYDVERDDVFQFFKDIKITEVRLPQDPNGRLKGFGYAEFEDRQSLVEALSLNNEQLKNRRVRVDVAGQQQDKDHDGGGGSNRTPESNRSELDSDWRSRSDDSNQLNGFMNERNGGYDPPRDRGFGDDRRGGGYDPPRDRGFGDDRRGGGYDPPRDRGFGDDRRGGGYDPPRDRGFGDDRRGGRYDAPRDRGFGGDRQGPPRDRFGGDRYGSDRYGSDRYGSSRDRFGSDRERGYGDNGPPRDRYDRYGDAPSSDRRYGGDRDAGGRSSGGSWGPRYQDRFDDRGYGRDQGGDHYGRRDSDRDFERESAPKERPKLQLQPRSKPKEESTQVQTSVRSPSIFGEAKPVDTAAKEREIEQKLERQKLADEIKLKEKHDMCDIREHTDKDDWKRGRRDSNRSSDGDKSQRERRDSHQSSDGERGTREPRNSPSSRGRSHSGSGRSNEEGREGTPREGAPRECVPRAAAKDMPLKKAPPPTENVWAKRLESRKAEESSNMHDRQPSTEAANRDVSEKVTTPPASSGRGGFPTSPSGRGRSGRALESRGDGSHRGVGRGGRGDHQERPSADGPGQDRREKKEKRERRQPEMKKYEEPSSPVFLQQSKFALLADEQEEEEVNE